MNSKAQMFQDYLQKNEKNMFFRRDLENEFHTSVFSSNFGIEKDSLPMAIVLDDTTYSMIQVQILADALKFNNDKYILRILNKWNCNLKLFKYVLDDEGNVVLTSCLLNKVNEADGDKIFAVLDVMLQYITDDYKNIMQVLQGK